METLPKNRNSPSLDETLRRSRELRGKLDLIFLMEEILGYPKMGRIHKEVELFLKRVRGNERKAVILLPRNHLKTTTITIAWTIQQILINPDVRIFITNERLANAQSFLREIKTHFEKNQKLRWIFGDYVNFQEKWTQDQIIVSKRKITRKEPTVQTGSLDTSLVSQHYDIIVADDLVSRANIATKDQMDKVKQYWKDLLSLLEVGGTLLDVGTRWHFDDLHGVLLEDLSYAKMTKACWDANLVPIFPEKFATSDLQAIKEGSGSYDFSCLYMNDPIDDEQASFKRSWFDRRFRETDLTGRVLNNFITIDNAPSTREGTDFQGIVVNSVDTQGNWYLRLVLRFKGNTPQLINKIFELYNFWNPVVIGVEQKAFDDLIRPYLEIEMRRRNQFPNVTELKDKGVRKEDRIRGRLQGRFENGQVFLQEKPEDNTMDLVDELTRFPKGSHDDLADALQYQSEIAFKPDGDEYGTQLGEGIYGPQDFK